MAYRIMKPRTKKDKIADCFTAFKQIQAGDKVKRIGAKDGSIQTHSIVPVTEQLTEAGVLKDCLDWLHHKGIMCNRHDAGTFCNSRGQWGTYGIKDAGDIIGILPNGIHFEVECKRGKGGRLTKGQQERWHKVVENNGIYLVVHGLAELEYFMGDII